MDISIKELRGIAKAKGINTFGMGKDQIYAAVYGGGVPEKGEAPEKMSDVPADSGTFTVDGMKFKRPSTTYDYSAKKKLDIPKDKLNNNLDYRWVSDHKGNIESRVEQGYATVPNLGGNTPVKRRGGTRKNGEALDMVLMATPKDFRKQRQDKAEELRRSLEDGIFSGEIDPTGNPLQKSEFYNKGSKIKS